MKIRSQVYSALIEHAKNGLPEEVCGYLAGKDGIIEKHYPLTNIDHSPEHFSMDPAEQFQAIKSIRAEGMNVLGVYHSHPETPARPSAEDINLAFDPAVSYLIVSLAKEKAEIKSFKIVKSVSEEEHLEQI